MLALPCGLNLPPNFNHTYRPGKDSWSGELLPINGGCGPVSGPLLPIRILEMESMVKASTIMKTDVITVTKGEDICDAIRIMILNNVTGLPVVNDDGTVAGIITEKDVLKLLYSGPDKGGTVEEFMTTNVVCFEQDASLADIADCLMMNRFRRVPIVRQAKLVGIISRKDIMRYISSVKQGNKTAPKNVVEIVY
jgi:CBS domain-containing protein